MWGIFSRYYEGIIVTDDIQKTMINISKFMADYQQSHKIYIVNA